MDIKEFWELSGLELLLNVPTLMKLLCCLVNKPEDKKALVVYDSFNDLEE